MDPPHSREVTTRTLLTMTSWNGNIFRVTGPLCGEFASPGEFPAQRPVTWSFDVFFDLRPNKRLSKQPPGWWFETPSWSLWRHCYAPSTDGWMRWNQHNPILLSKFISYTLWVRRSTDMIYITFNKHVIIPLKWSFIFIFINNLNCFAKIRPLFYIPSMFRLARCCT